MDIQQILQDEFNELLNINNNSFFTDKTVLITGGAGSIGSKLSFLLCKTSAKKVIILDNSESDLFEIQQILKIKGLTKFEIELADIVNKSDVNRIFEKYKPEVIYHTAAYKNVPLLEQFPLQAFRVNVLGTKNIIENAISINVNDLVFISTDKAVYPQNIMGKTKRLAEMYISQYYKHESINIKTVRFGNIPNTKGSILPLWGTQLKLTGKINVVDQSVYRYFISLNKVLKVLLEIVSVSEDNLFITNMGDPVRIHDLAEDFLLRNNKDKSLINKIKTRPGDKNSETLSYKDEVFQNTTNGDYLSGLLEFDKGNYMLLKSILEDVNNLDSIDLLEKIDRIIDYI